MENNVAAKRILTFGNEFVLFELPFIGEPAVLLRVVFQMQTMVQACSCAPGTLQFLV